MAAIALNQPYIPKLIIPKEKIDTLFSLMNQMDTQEIKQFSMIHNVPLNVLNPTDSYYYLFLIQKNPGFGY